MSARIEKVRVLIERFRTEAPADFAWKEYLWAKEKKNFKVAEFWMNCYIAWGD